MKLRVYNSTLDPKIWNDDKTIKPDIRDALLKIAEDFYNSTDLNGEIHDILFIGSSANYNWTPSSDVDLHLVIDIAEEKINEEYARKFMDSLGFKWNTEHDIEIKEHPVEVYLQDIREPNSTAQLSRDGAAIYSLFDGRWLQEPEKRNLKVDAEKIKQKYQTIKLKVEKLVQTNDIEKLKELMKSIRNYRNTGLASGGEFCVENLVFKALRKSGELKTIKDTINQVYDKQVSLPEHGNMQPSTDTTPLNEETAKKYLVVGWINKNLEIIAETDLVGGDNITHDKLLYNRPDYEEGEWESLRAWRYKSSNNTIYWYEEADDKMKQSVTNYLAEKFNVSNPQQITSISLASHRIDEMADKSLKKDVKTLT